MQIVWKPTDRITVTPANQLCWSIDAGHVTIGGKTHAAWPTKRFMAAFTVAVGDTQMFWNFMFGVN